MGLGGPTTPQLVGRSPVSSRGTARRGFRCAQFGYLLRLGISGSPILKPRDGPLTASPPCLRTRVRIVIDQHVSGYIQRVGRDDHMTRLRAKSPEENSDP